MIFLRASTLLAIAAATISASAQVTAYSTIPSNGTYNQGTYVTGDVSYGYQFSPSVSGQLSSFQLAINDDDGSPDRDPFTLTLYADDGSNRIGSPLGFYSGLSSGIQWEDTNSALVTVSAGSAAPRLTAGQNYWLEAESDLVVWGLSPTVLSNKYRVENIHHAHTYYSGPAAAFSVQVIPVPVLEPTTFATFGIPALAFLRRRKRS